MFFQIRFEGTKVTIENFVAWKTKFDTEMAELKRLNNQREQQASSKLSGKKVLLASRSNNKPVVNYPVRKFY